MDFLEVSILEVIKMHWVSSISENPDLFQAFNECSQSLFESLEGKQPDLIVGFPSEHHSEHFSELSQLVDQFFGNATFFGCSGAGVIGGGKEVEQVPSLALCAAYLPDVTISPFIFQEQDLPDGDSSPDDWYNLVQLDFADDPIFVILSHPSAMFCEDLLRGLDFAFPESKKIGGIASGYLNDSQVSLFLDNELIQSGIIGICMTGDIQIDTIVAQGCRPIGSAMQVTECQQNILYKLNDQTPVEILRSLFPDLNEREKDLVQHSLFLGVLMDSFIEKPEHGDFLIRNILGIDSRQGAIGVGEFLHEGQIVQFHVRDGISSSDDLATALQKYVEFRHNPSGYGALLFSCLGRGQQLYQVPNHDTKMFYENVGVMPVTGFFGNGEIGPVGDNTYLHGYTSSFGIFRPSSKVDF